MAMGKTATPAAAGDVGGHYGLADSGTIVRRDTGESYQEFLTQLAQASGIETPTADSARIDPKRTKKGSNDDWTHPHDSDARIAKMKDGRTHLGDTTTIESSWGRPDRQA